jgi:hypothetical protein
LASMPEEGIPPSRYTKTSATSRARALQYFLSFNPHFRDRVLRRFILQVSSKELRATLTAIVRADTATALPLWQEVVLSLCVTPSYLALAVTRAVSQRNGDCLVL